MDYREEKKGEIWTRTSVKIHDTTHDESDEDT